MKISDQFGPIVLRIWQSVDPCSTEKPKTGSFVTYHYICRDESGNRIDSTYDENAPIHAKIGSGNIIQVRFQLQAVPGRTLNCPWYEVLSVSIRILKQITVSVRRPFSNRSLSDFTSSEDHKNKFNKINCSIQ